MTPCRHCGRLTVKVGYAPYEITGERVAVRTDVPDAERDTMILTISGRVVTGKRIPPKDRKKHMVGAHLRSGCYYGDVLQKHVCEEKDAYISRAMEAYQ